MWCHDWIAHVWIISVSELKTTPVGVLGPPTAFNSPWRKALKLPLPRTLPQLAPPRVRVMATMPASVTAPWHSKDWRKPSMLLVNTQPRYYGKERPAIQLPRNKSWATKTLQVKYKTIINRKSVHCNTLCFKYSQLRTDGSGRMW